MPQLLLLRHAKSSWDDPKLPDHSRPLNARGKAAASNVGRLLRLMQLTPDRILVSSSRRTLQTLEQLEPWDIQPQVEIHDRLYIAPSEAILDEIHEVPPATERLMVVGHNPGLHELGLLLIHGAEGAEPQRLHNGFPTAALACFHFDGAWTDLKKGRASLDRFVVPNDVAESSL